jgi:hypothetical protein
MVRELREGKGGQGQRRADQEGGDMSRGHVNRSGKECSQYHAKPMESFNQEDMTELLF